MQFENAFQVFADPDEVFRTMLDIPAVASCLPGATVGDRQEDGSYAASIAVKLGPVRMTYNGTVQVTESDPASRAATLLASGRELRGQGTARATIAMQVTAAADGSRVMMETAMQITGRVAQMGAGIMGEVADSMVNQFADCLQGTLAIESSVAAAVAESSGTADSRRPPAPVAAELRALPLLLRAIRARITRLLRRP